MFEVRCLVADKRLADVLRALRKLTLEPPVTIAVDEPQANGSGLITSAKPIAGRSGQSARKSVEDFVQRRIKNGAKTITATELREFMAESGYSDRTYSYPLSLLVKDKILKTTRVQGIYEVA